MTGLTNFQFIGLTGIYALQFKRPLKVVYSGTYPVCIISIEDKNKEIEINATFNCLTGTVLGELVWLTNQKSGQGLKLFQSHLRKVTAMGFDVIQMHAAKETLDDGRVLFGYKVWAKIGFTMEQDYQIEFLKLMHKHGNSCQWLHELQATEMGNKFWEDEGWAWLGRFQIVEPSINQDLFRKYMTAKT